MTLKVKVKRKTATAKNRWFYITTILDLQIYDIILTSTTKFITFDKKEISDPIIRKIKDKHIQTFLINQAVEEELTKVIKDKKNRHIVFILRNGKKPEALKKELEELTKKVSPSSNFYFNLVCDNEDYINHEDFYSVYVLNPELDT